MLSDTGAPHADPFAKNAVAFLEILLLAHHRACATAPQLVLRARPAAVGPPCHWRAALSTSATAPDESNTCRHLRDRPATLGDLAHRFGFEPGPNAHDSWHAHFRPRMREEVSIKSRQAHPSVGSGAFHVATAREGAIGLAGSIVVGHSMGGLAARIAAQQQEAPGLGDPQTILGIAPCTALILGSTAGPALVCRLSARQGPRARHFLTDGEKDSRTPLAVGAYSDVCVYGQH